MSLLRADDYFLLGLHADLCQLHANLFAHSMWTSSSHALTAFILEDHGITQVSEHFPITW